MPDQNHDYRVKLRNISALAGIGLVVCAVFGALWSLPPEGLTAAGLALGICVGLSIASQSNIRRASPRVSLLLAALLATSPLSLPFLEVTLDGLRSRSQQPLLALLCAAVVAAAVVTTLIPRASRAALPSSQLTYLAMATGLVLGVSRLLPDITPIWIGLAGLALLVWPILSSDDHDTLQRAMAPESSKEDGSIRGLVIGAAVPMLWMAAGPIYASTAGWIMQSLTGLLLGFAAAQFARGWLAEFCRTLAPALLPLGLLVAAEILLRGPALLLTLQQLLGESASDGYLLSMLVTAGVFALLGFLSGPTGRKSAPTAALGLLGFLVLPSLMGVDAALRVLVGLAALLHLPQIVAQKSVRNRLIQALFSLAALIALLRPPTPAALRLVAPYEAFSEPLRLASLVRTLAERPAQVSSSVAGSVISSPGGQQNLLYYRGTSLELGPQQRAADHFFGHLAGLLGDPPSSTLLLGAGSGAVIDALRRGSGGIVQVYEPSPALRRLLRSHGEWNRQAAADPAVRLLRSSPLTKAAENGFDAILIDMPPPWLAGSPSHWGAARIKQVSTHLSTRGSAIFRLPLAALSADELSTFIVLVCREFPSVSAWLNPSGAQNLLLVARHQDQAVSGGAFFAGWKRKAVRDDMAAATLSRPEDALERLLANQYGLLKMTANRGRRSWLGTSIVSGSRVRHGRRGVPLAALTEATQHEVPLVDISAIPEEDVAQVQQRLQQAREVRRVYLQMLDSWAAGKAGEALGLATQLAQKSASPARDLKAIIQPWLRRGDALRAQGLWEQARSEFLMAASFSPRDIEANLALADACRILGEHDESERHYKLVLAEDGEHLEASLGLADLRQRQGRVAEAVEFLEVVEKSHPGSFPLLVNLAFGQMQLARGSDSNVGQRLSRARVLFQRAAALEPGRPQARAGLGEVYFRMGQYKRALSELDRALLLEDSCHYRSWRGHALFSLGRTDEAEQEVQTALLACPNLIDALVLLGNITADQSRYKRAREAWEQVLTIEPDNQAARFNLDQLEESGVERLEQ